MVGWSDTIAEIDAFDDAAFDPELIAAFEAQSDAAIGRPIRF